MNESTELAALRVKANAGDAGAQKLAREWLAAFEQRN